jgi:hypothetical protein
MAGKRRLPRTIRCLGGVVVSAALAALNLSGAERFFVVHAPATSRARSYLVRGE